MGGTDQTHSLSWVVRDAKGSIPALPNRLHGYRSGRYDGVSADANRQPPRGCHIQGMLLNHLRTISLLMTVLGIALIAAALLAGASPTVGLIGMMLVVAGAVKIVIVKLWHSVASFGAPAETAMTAQSRKE